jgi:hypothetical protein
MISFAPEFFRLASHKKAQSTCLGPAHGSGHRTRARETHQRSRRDAKRKAPILQAVPKKNGTTLMAILSSRRRYNNSDRFVLYLAILGHDALPGKPCNG